MAFSLRLDPDTEARIRRYAKATGRSKSAIVREAMSQYEGPGVETGRVDFGKSTLARLSQFAGVVSTGGQFSTNTHAKFKAVAGRKHRARRSR